MKILTIIAALALAPPAISLPQSALSIEGVIVDDASNPIPGAEVRAVWSNPPVRFTPDEIPTAYSDSNGRFSIQGLAIGGYRIQVRAQGFAGQIYGSKRSGEPGEEIVLTATDRRRNLTVKLIAAGTISGRILSSTGEPLTGIDVHALRRVYDSTGWKSYSSAAPAVQTNDRGEYRIAGLPPGRYYVRADALWPGRPDPSRPLPGRSPVSSGKFEATYYPRSPLIEGAELVEVLQRADVRSVDFVLRKEQTYNIRGNVTQTDGSPPAFPGFRVVPLHAEQISVISIWTPCKGPITELNREACELNTYRPDGTFELKNIQPGLYSVTAQLPIDFSQEQLQSMRQPGVDFASLPYPRQAMAVVRITDSDVDNVHLVFSQNLSVNGRVTVDGDSLAQFSSSVPLQLGIRAVTLGELEPIRKAVIDSEGRFVIGSLSSNEYRLDLSGLPPELFVVSARLGDTNALGDFTLFSPPADTLNVALSSRAGQAEGIVIDSKSNPVSNAQVVVIPVIDRSQPSRPDLYKVSRSDVDGKFKVANIAPGNYTVCIWDNDGNESYFDPSAVRQIEDRCVPLQIVSGTTAQLNVKAEPAR